MTFTDPAASVAVVDNQHNDRSYVDWPAIIAGVALASAFSVLMLAFGSAIGLSLASPYEGEGPGAGLAIAAGLWLVWVQVSGFFAGAYLTGRLRRRFHDSSNDEKEVRDGSHGLLVWAAGLLLGAWIAASGIGSLASTATNAAATVASGAAAGAADAATDAVTGGGNDLLIDRLLRPSAPAAGAAPADSAAPATPPAGDSQAARDEIGRILTGGLTSGQLDDADRQYLVSTVQQRTGVDEATAGQRVDQLVAGAQQAEQTARDAADAARRYSVIVAFMTAASSLVSALAAYFAAGLGGKHRDENTYFTGGWEMFR